MKSIRRSSAVLLIVVAIAMIVIGFTGDVVVPPILTGVGFLAIAAVFFERDRESRGV